MAILGKSEIKISCSNIKKSQVGKRDLSPLLRLRFTYTGAKDRSGDKSLFPTCDFLMLGEKTDFFPSKAKLKMAKLQNVHVEITKMHRARKLRMHTVA